MNASVYIFGEFNRGYSQFPDDYASLIFHNFSANAKSTTQIAVHRNGNLMYYGYIRKLQQDRYLGLCVVLNGLMLKRINGLFSLFEKTISNLVINGHLIHFDEQGELVTSVDKLYLNSEEADLLTASLRAGFNRFEIYSAPLPAVSYSTPKDSCEDFVVTDSQDKIVKSSYTNGYTYIYKSKGFNTAQINSYKGVLAKSYKEKQELAEKLDALEKEHTKTLKQKKQFKYVIIMFLILLGCCIGLFLLNDNLNLTRNALSNANDTISMQSDSLNVKYREISNLHKEKNELDARRQAEENKRLEAESNLDSLKKIISDRQPFIVKTTSFNFETGYLDFDYYGMREEESVNITIRAYNDEGAFYTNSSSINIHTGDNSASIFLNRRLNAGKWYSFELLIDNIILGGDRH